MLSDFVPVVGAAWRLNGGGNEDTLGSMVLLKEEATGERERGRELTVVFAASLVLAVGYLVLLINGENGTGVVFNWGEVWPGSIESWVIDWSVYWRIQGEGTIISLELFEMVLLPRLPAIVNDG